MSRHTLRCSKLKPLEFDLAGRPVKADRRAIPLPGARAILSRMSRARLGRLDHGEVRQRFDGWPTPQVSGAAQDDPETRSTEENDGRGDQPP